MTEYYHPYTVIDQRWRLFLYEDHPNLTEEINAKKSISDWIIWR